MHSYLRRLDPEFYRGLARVHWSLGIEDRGTGWLDRVFHARFREISAHTCFRYGVLASAYCLMPDHLHLLWLGWREDSDQRTGMRFFRKHLNALLTESGHVLQKQPYDHVLREAEAQDDAVMEVAAYVLANPVRAGLSGCAGDYHYSGCIIPGYPELDAHAEDFWDRHWKVFLRLREGASS